MSESGDAPAQSHCPHHGHRNRRRRRILLCLAFAILALLLLAAAAAIVVLAVLRPRDPTTELLSATATGAVPNVVAPLPNVSVQLNLTFLLVVRVRNPNPAAFRHGAATTSLLYRGAAVGNGVVPPGTIPSRGETIMRLSMTVQADRVVAAAGIGGLIADVLAGEMEFEARTEVPGTVVLLGFVKRSVEAKSVCRVVIGVADVKVRRQECHNEVKL